jgi:hypothetical protein
MPGGRKLAEYERSESHAKLRRGAETHANLGCLGMDPSQVHANLG